MRDQIALTSERRALAAYTSTTTSGEFLRFLRGATAALEWVAGAAPAPVSGNDPEQDEAPDTPTAELLAAEVRRCDALLVGVPVAEPGLTPLADPHYVNGVEHALRWMLGLEPEPPVPFVADQGVTGAEPAA